ncbi:MAG: hypothetical protein AAFU72_13090 [Pseudomonadota bacterium]
MTTVDAIPAAVPPLKMPKRSYVWAVLGFLLFAAGPALAAAWYYYEVAADRYVTGLRYAIRGGPGVEGQDGGSVQGAGFAAALSDGFILEDFLRSEAALAELEARLDLRAMLGRDGGDPVRAYDAGMPPEDLLAYWNAALGLRFDVLTGITHLEVRLFHPEDSLAVAEALVSMLDALVDRLSEQQQNEMLAYVNGEYAQAERRLKDTLDAIEAFRRRTLTVSPTQEAELNTATIAQLTSELTGLRVRLRTLIETVPNSPQIRRLREQIQSLEAQIANTRATVGGARSGSALPVQLTDFERLQNEYQIALDSYIATLGLQQQAQAQATLGRAHLVVFVPPRQALTATAPDRPVEVLKIAVAAFLLWVMGRVLLAALRTP